MTKLLDPENEAALACVASLTRWFAEGPVTESLTSMTLHDPGLIVAFLFGQLVSAIEILAEEAELTPLQYVQAMALDVSTVCYFD